MIQFREFSENGVSTVVDQLNEFVKNHNESIEVIDVQYAVWLIDSFTYSSVLLMYKLDEGE